MRKNTGFGGGQRRRVRIGFPSSLAELSARIDKLRRATSANDTSAATMQRARIFVNYRNTDEPYAAALVDHALSFRFGTGQVFRAGKSIRPGEDFATRILTAVRNADVLLSLIGPRWADARDRDGRLRLGDPEDWVRREIAEALRCGVRIVPVLLDVSMPRPASLPADIRSLASCQYLRLHPRNSWVDLSRLVEELGQLVPGLDRAR